MTKQKSRKRKQIQHSGTVEFGIALAKVAAKASTAPKKLKKARRSDSYKLA